MQAAALQLTKLKDYQKGADKYMEIFPQVMLARKNIYDISIRNI